MIKTPDCEEGPEAYRRFEDAMRAVLAVQQRIEEHRNQADPEPA